MDNSRNECGSKMPIDKLQRLRRDPAAIESLLATLAMVILSAGLTLVIAWLWVMRWMLAADKEPVDGVVLVLGHRLENNQPSLDYQARLARAAELARKRPALALLLLGGGQPSEAQVGRTWLLSEAGLDPARIMLEEQSEDSLQNLRNARALLRETGPVHVLSNRYHLGRLRLVAAQLGLQVELVPAEPRPRLFPPLGKSFAEAAYVCWFASGRFWARVARRRSLLERIS